jgi:Flp pilus assembly protein TadD
MGQPSGAIGQFKLAAQLNPQDGLAHCALGKALIKQGQVQKGQEELNSAHALGVCN